MAVFELKNKNLTVRVNSFGAELNSVFSHDYAIEYIWQADPSVWARYAPHLFPIVGKLKDGSYSYHSKNYELPQHGFARDNEFICIEQEEDCLLFELTANEDTLKKYPFHFSFQIKYTLTANQLKVSYSVFNPDNNDLYFSVGAHPAFNCPLQKDESFNDYELIFPHKNELIINTLSDGLISETTQQIVLQDHKLKVSRQLFDHDALVCMNSQIEEVQLVSTKTKHGVSLKSLNWPYYGIWTKKGTEQFICLEPWHGIADYVNATGDIIQKKGIIKLEASNYFHCHFDLLFF
ncbi:MAG: aldose 1-epimerase family protein [Bacteroidetes bacterium]|nr:aldose 1-epimerase family protein [Bacteroidota bacterium]